VILLVIESALSSEEEEDNGAKFGVEDYNMKDSSMPNNHPQQRNGQKKNENSTSAQKQYRRLPCEHPAGKDNEKRN